MAVETKETKSSINKSYSIRCKVYVEYTISGKMNSTDDRNKSLVY